MAFMALSHHKSFKVTRALEHPQKELEPRKKIFYLITNKDTIEIISQASNFLANLMDGLEKWINHSQMMMRMK